MSNHENNLWLNIRDCQQTMTTILKAELIPRQPSYFIRQHANSVGYHLQVRTDKAMDDYNSKRKKCLNKIRRLVCGDYLGKRVDDLLADIHQFQESLERGAW